MKCIKELMEGEECDGKVLSGKYCFCDFSDYRPHHNRKREYVSIIY